MQSADRRIIHRQSAPKVQLPGCAPNESRPTGIARYQKHMTNHSRRRRDRDPIREALDAAWARRDWEAILTPGAPPNTCVGQLERLLSGMGERLVCQHLSEDMALIGRRIPSMPYYQFLNRPELMCCTACVPADERECLLDQDRVWRPCDCCGELVTAALGMMSIPGGDGIGTATAIGWLCDGCSVVPEFDGVSVLAS